jgi:hypothetical protein
VPAAGRIRAWLAGSGYASAAAFNEPDHLMLPTAVRNEAAQAGRGDGDGRASLPRPGEEGRQASAQTAVTWCESDAGEFRWWRGAEQRERGSVMGRSIRVRHP